MPAPAHHPTNALRLRAHLEQVVEARVDHNRVVDIMRRAGQLPLVKDYLLAVQKNNLLAVSWLSVYVCVWGGGRLSGATGATQSTG